MQRVTIREVAALAGVAVSTVSAVLNQDSGGRVASATRARVLQAVEVLGYTPHQAARALRGKNMRVLVLIDDDVSTGPYGGQLLAGVHDVCQDLGVPVVGLTTGGSPGRERDALEFARSMPARAIVLASVAEAVRDLPAMKAFILLNGRAPHDDGPGVVPDNEAGAADVIGELLAVGHRRIGLLTIGRCEAADRRLEAARESIRTAWGPAAIDPELVVRMSNVEATAGGGRDGARRLLNLADPPTAIACFNDRMAMGCYQAVAEQGLRVPHDVSIVGFDNVEPVAESLEPGLTTVALPEREMGQLSALVALGLDHTHIPEAVEVSFDREQVSRVGSTFRVRCPVVIRGSVGPPSTGVGRPAPRRKARAQ